jgi:hypothetical protein
MSNTLVQLTDLAALVETKRLKAKAAWAAYRVPHEKLIALCPMYVMRTPYWTLMPALPEGVLEKGLPLEAERTALKRVAMAAGKVYRMMGDALAEAWLRRDNAILHHKAELAKHQAALEALDKDYDSDSDTDSDSDDE